MHRLVRDQLKGWTILVVDDEPDCLEVASRWLKLAGAVVLTASDGRQGLAIAVSQQPALILADLSMPVMDGWEMQRELLKNPATARIPVVALTAHVMQDVKDQALAAGFVAHISKPLDPDKFIAHLLKIVKDISGPKNPPDA